MNCEYCQRPVRLKSKRGHRRRYCNNTCSGKARWRRIKASDRLRLEAGRSAKISLQKRLDSRWERIFSIHGDKCCKCKHTYPGCCYDLHHTRLGTKKSKRDNSAVVLREGSDAKFEALLKITELVCANCHRIHHSNGKPYGKI